MKTDLSSSALTTENGNRDRIYRVGLKTTDLLYALGEVLVGWLLLRGAAISHSALNSDVSQADTDFYQGKIATAEFFARQILPSVTAIAESVELVDESIMELDLTAF